MVAKLHIFHNIAKLEHTSKPKKEKKNVKRFVG